MGKVPHTTMRLTELDLAILDAVQTQQRLMSRSEALRYVLRYWSEREGVAVKAPKPSAKRRKR